MDKIKLQPLSKDQAEYLAKVEAANIDMDDLCPKCGKRYGEHIIGPGGFCPVSH
jgi:hypothetical protein